MANDSKNSAVAQGAAAETSETQRPPFNAKHFDVLYEGQERAEILTIGDEPLTRKTQEGDREYLRCTVRFTEGALAGEEFFANRTLGEEKAEISEGQRVTVYIKFMQKKPEFLKKNERNDVLMFGEISTSTVSSAANMLKKLLNPAA